MSKVRVGFIVGKHTDCVEGESVPGDVAFLADLPDEFRVDPVSYQFLADCGPGTKGSTHVDVAIAWHVQKYCPDIEVDIIRPRQITAERLRSNACNFIVGWDLIDAKLFGSPAFLEEMTEVFRTCENLVPSFQIQEFIYYKSRYLKACMAAGVPTAPTLFAFRGEVDANGLLRQIKARGWTAFVMKKSFNAFGIGFKRFSVQECEEFPGALQAYLDKHADCPEFIVQEALQAFAQHWETRVFWWNGAFVYAIAYRVGSGEDILTDADMPEDFLEGAKRVGREALKVLPEWRGPHGQRIGMTLIRTDIGCSEGCIQDSDTNWDPNEQTFFLNEIEYGGTNYFARHLPFDCIPLWAEKYAETSREVHAKSAGPARLKMAKSAAHAWPQLRELRPDDEDMAEPRCFICHDRSGNGAEVWAPAGTLTGHVFRRAVDSLRGAWSKGDEPLRFLARNPLRAHETRELGIGDLVPENLFFARMRIAGDETPVTQIEVVGARFSSRNARLQARIDRVSRLLGDLIEEFGRPEYRGRVAAAPDRVTVQRLIREVQLRVMPRHGFPIDGASPGLAHELVMQMKAFNSLGTLDPNVLAAVSHAQALSGAAGLDSLPPRARPREVSDPDAKDAPALKDRDPQPHRVEAGAATEILDLTRQVWKVTGGQDKGGVLVREGLELSSSKLAERLCTGALVLEERLVCDEQQGIRLHYRRLTGSGPDRGWISVRRGSRAISSIDKCSGP